MSTEILPEQSAPDEVLTAPPRYAPRPKPRRASRSKPATPMARCIACDAPNVDDRTTCWRCLRPLDADPEPVAPGPAPVTRPTEAPVARASVAATLPVVAEPVVAEPVVAEPVAVEGGAAEPDVAEPVAAPVAALSVAAALPVAAEPTTAAHVPRPAQRVSVPVWRPPEIRVAPRAPVPPAREVTLSTRVTPGRVLSPWPVERPRRRRRRYLAIASVAVLLVVSIVGVASLNLGTGGGNKPGDGSGSLERDLLAAALVAPSPTPAPTDPPRSTPAPFAAPAVASEPQTDVAAALEAAILTGRQPEPVEPEVSRVPATQVAVSPEGTATTDVPAGRAPRGKAFTCGGAAPDPIRDLRDRTWRITKVSFRHMGGFERVIIHLDRLGDARPGDRTVAIAGRVSTKQLAELPSDVHPERERRGLLRVALPGVPEGPELRAFRPLGIANVGELSLLPGRNGRTALLAIDDDACYRVRVPEWGPAGSDDTRRAEVVIDIRD